MKELIVAIGLIFSVTAFSGPRVTGNGGDAVVSADTVNLLDLVENQYSFLNVSKEPYAKMYQYALVLFFGKVGWNPVRTREITWALTDLPLEDIHDEGSIRIQDPENIQQLAIQKNGVVLIYSKLYDKLSEKGKAALITHEILIATAINLGYDLSSAKGTGPIRQLVSMLFSSNASAPTENFYRQIWDQLPLAKDSPAELRFNYLEVVSGSLDYAETDSYYLKFIVQNPRFKQDGIFYAFRPRDEDMKSGVENGWDVCRAFGWWGEVGETHQREFLTTPASLATADSLGRTNIRVYDAGTPYFTSIMCDSHIYLDRM